MTTYVFWGADENNVGGTTVESLRARYGTDVVIIRPEPGVTLAQAAARINPAEGANIILLSHGGTDGTFQWQQSGDQSSVGYGAFFRELPNGVGTISVASCYGGLAQNDLRYVPPGALLQTFVGEGVVNYNGATLNFANEIGRNPTPTTMLLEALDNVDMAPYRNGEDPRTVLPHIVGIGGNPPIRIDVAERIQQFAASEQRFDRRAIEMVQDRFDINGRDDNHQDRLIGRVANGIQDNKSTAEIARDLGISEIEVTRMSYALMAAQMEVSGSLAAEVAAAKSASTAERPNYISPQDVFNAEIVAAANALSNSPDAAGAIPSRSNTHVATVALTQTQPDGPYQAGIVLDGPIAQNVAPRGFGIDDLSAVVRAQTVTLNGEPVNNDARADIVARFIDAEKTPDAGTRQRAVLEVMGFGREAERFGAAADEYQRLMQNNTLNLMQGMNAAERIEFLNDLKENAPETPPELRASLTQLADRAQAIWPADNLPDIAFTPVSPSPSTVPDAAVSRWGYGAASTVQDSQFIMNGSISAREDQLIQNALQTLGYYQKADGESVTTALHRAINEFCAAQTPALDAEAVIRDLEANREHPAFLSALVNDVHAGRVKQGATLTAGIPIDMLDRDTAEAMQTFLNTQGIKGENGQPLRVDGIVGRQTRHAFEEFCEQNGLNPNDGITQETIRLIATSQAVGMNAAEMKASVIATENGTLTRAELERIDAIDTALDRLESQGVNTDALRAEFAQVREAMRGQGNEEAVTTELGQLVAAAGPNAAAIREAAGMAR